MRWGGGRPPCPSGRLAGAWLALLIVGLAACGPGHAAEAPATPEPEAPASLMGDEPVVASFASPAYGVYTFLWWRPDIAARDLDLVADMGFGWVKQDFAWREIEGIKKGHYDWWKPDTLVAAAEARGINILARLDRQPFWSQEPDSRPRRNGPPLDAADYGDFCGAIAERYRGRIAAYQVWNEPNLSREWGESSPDPVAYVELLRVCYQAIKQADPQAIVVSAGLAPTGTANGEAMPDIDYLAAMYEAGAASYFDVLGVNAPGYKAPPEASPAEAAARPEYGGGRWFAFRHVEDLRAMMVANGDGAKQVAITEMGWTLDTVNAEYAWFAVDEATQADYLARAYAYAREHWRPWIGVMITIYIADYEWTPEANEQWWWAIVLPDGTPRLAYTALQEMDKE